MKRFVVGMVLLLAAPLLAVAQQQSASAVQGGSFLAIAYNSYWNESYAGYETWQPDGLTPLQAWQSAKGVAMNRCEEDTIGTPADGQCRRAVWVYNGYAAIAEAKNAAWGSGAGEFRSDAIDHAVQSCVAHGGKGCEQATVRVSRPLDPQQNWQGGPWHVAPNVSRIQARTP